MMTEYRKHIIYISLGLCLLISLVLLLKASYIETENYTKAHDEVKELSSQKDSLFSLADQVLDNVIHEKEVNDSIVSDLDSQVRNKEITIDQQVIQLKMLLKEANDAKDFALEQQEKASEMSKMSIIQSQQSNEAKQKAHFEYQKLLEENARLLEEIEELKKNIDKFKITDSDIINSMEYSDSLDINIDLKGKNKSKKKKD